MSDLEKCSLCGSSSIGAKLTQVETYLSMAEKIIMDIRGVYLTENIDYQSEKFDDAIMQNKQNIREYVTKNYFRDHSSFTPYKRMLNNLHFDEIIYFNDLVGKTCQSLLKIPGMGIKNVCIIKCILKDMGYELPFGKLRPKQFMILESYTKQD